jgi:hypothetical protein
MDLLTRDDIEQLASAGGGVHISLFMPTHRTGRETEGDPIRWKNLVSGVADALAEDGMNRTDIDELLAPATDLHADAFAWQHMSDGLAAFLQKGSMQVYRLPITLPELATVGESFVVGPALPLLRDDLYFVLALSQRRVRLLAGGRQRVEEVELPGVPTSFDAVFAPDEGRSDTVSKPVSSRRGRAGAHYSGMGLDGTERKEEVAAYLHEVANGVYDQVGRHRRPMILAGLPEVVAAYREANHYSDVLDAAVETNPDDLSDEELHQRAWEIVRARLEQEDTRAIDRLEETRANGRGTTDLDDVVKAAQEGRVDTLLLTRTGWWGGDGGAEAVVRLGGGEVDPSELLDAAAAATLTTSGAIRVVEQLPDEAQAGAILRY